MEASYMSAFLFDFLSFLFEFSSIIEDPFYVLLIVSSRESSRHYLILH